MLFIDTLHVYGQVKREIALHHHNVRKYLVFHDTVCMGEEGEKFSTWTMHSREELREQKGWSDEDLDGGINKAIDEFLEASDGA